MKVMYRPIGGIAGSVIETKIFNSLYEMLEYVNTTKGWFDVSDVSISYWCNNSEQNYFNEKIKSVGKTYAVSVSNLVVGFCKIVEE